MRRIFISLLMFAGQCLAGVSANTVWEVRTTGSDTNGGGFVAGASGTDMSQFDNKNAAACTSCQSATVNISTTDAVAAGTTTITSVTGNFSSALIGNIVEFSGGSGSITAVWKQVLTVPGATSFTIDSSIAISTGMTMNIGGALLTIGKAAVTLAVSSNIVFVKATGTYSITAGMALANNMTPTNAAPPNQIIGYTTARTDGGRATVQYSTNANITGFDGTNAGGYYISNFVIDCNSLSGAIGVRVNVNSVLRNLQVKNCTIAVNLANGSATLMDSDITANTPATGNGSVNAAGAQTFVLRCYIHDNTGNGINLQGNGATALYNVIASNSNVGGADGSGNGIITGSNGSNFIMHNTIYNSGRDGIQFAGNILGASSTVRNNLIAKSARYGLNGYITNPGWGSFPQWDGNAFWLSAGTANRHNADDTGTVNPVNAANPYTNSLDVTLSVDPFTSASTHDFTLNTAATGGALATGTGTPGALPGLSQTGSPSFGALQPSTAASITVSASAFVQ